MRWQITLLITVLAVAVAAGAEASAALDHHSVQSLLTMLEEGATEEEILDRLEEIGAFPELDGHDLAELKRRGITDRVLLKMIEMPLIGSESTATPRHTDVEPVAPDDRGIIRVLLQCPIKVTFIEVTVNGDIKRTEGTMLDDAVGSALHLESPPRVCGESPALLLEATVAPGRHSTSFGFAVTEIKSVPSEVWGEAPGEQFETRGIRAAGGSLPGQAPAGNPGATCQLSGGQVCEVLVTPQRTSSSLLRGASVYNVRYQVQMYGVTEDEEESTDDEELPEEPAQ